MAGHHPSRWTRSVLLCFSMAIVALHLLDGLCAGVSATPLAPSKEQMLQNAMQQMLHIHPSRIKQQLNQSEMPSQPPQYMLQLYQRYLGSEAMKSRSNTIRSIIPLRGGIEDDETLQFNLSTLSQTEEITSAELHFFKKQHGKRQSSSMPQSSSSSPSSPSLSSSHKHRVHLLATSVDRSKRNHIRRWPINNDKRGWQVIDVTQAVDQWMEAHQSADLLAFQFECGHSSDPHIDWMPLDTVIRMDPSPFLIIFSNEVSNVTLEDTGLLNSDPVQGNALPDSSTSAFHQRFARSIDDNELPESDSYSSGPVSQTSPGVLQARGSRPASPRKNSPGKSTSTSSWKPSRSGSISRTPKPVNEDGDEDGMTLSWPGERTGGGSSKRKSRKGKRRHRKLPETWHYNQQQHVNDARLDVPEDATRSLCQRRKLVVDFNEIGWSEWIISPKTFEAHYCAGRCPFPLTKELNPTNHATIQSIVHAIGGHPQVPAPCCVPDVLSSLTLLYFDDNRNVVLKNYPSMTAESCACR